MGIYRDEAHAVRRAMAVERLGDPKPAGWQMQYRPGYLEGFASGGGCDVLSRDEMLNQDSQTRALIHRCLLPEQWWVLVALYEANDSEREAACMRLAAAVQTPADALFKGVAIGTYAFADKRRKAKIIPIAHWTLLEDTPERTLRRWRKDIHDALEALRRSAMLHLQRVLKDAGLIGEHV